jgi:hypothetical protein
MDPIDEVGPELALAFTRIAAVGSSMIRRFRIEDAKSCTRVCRRILLCSPTILPPGETNNVYAITCIDAIAAAIALLSGRLCPLDDIDTWHLSVAGAAIATLRHELASNSAVVSNQPEDNEPNHAPSFDATDPHRSFVPHAGPPQRGLDRV